MDESINWYEIGEEVVNELEAIAVDFQWEVGEPYFMVENFYEMAEQLWAIREELA